MSVRRDLGASKDRYTFISMINNKIINESVIDYINSINKDL